MTPRKRASFTARIETAHLAAPCTARAPSAASILALLAAIEQRGPADPAAAAFRAALARKGREAEAVGGADVRNVLAQEIAAADPALADQRLAALAQAWSGIEGAA